MTNPKDTLISTLIEEWFAELGYFPSPPYKKEEGRILEKVMIDMGIDYKSARMVVERAIGNHKKTLLESPEEDILNFLNADPVAKEYNPDKVVSAGGNKYKVYFGGVNSRDTTGRTEILNKIRSTDKVDISLVKKQVAWSSIGYISMKMDSGKEYLVSIKGTSETSTSTTVKEGLVILFYNTRIKEPVNQENFEYAIDELIKALEVPMSSGLSESDKDEIYEFLSTVSYSKFVASSMNQSLSQALTIKSGYKRSLLIRTGLFDEYRQTAASKLGLYADKWCPGDIYVLLNESEARRILNIASQEENGSVFAETINEAFNEEWGSTIAPLTAVSLKFEKAQGGKAKNYFQRFKGSKKDYNLTSDEMNFKEPQFREGITRLRKSLSSLINPNDNIEYNLLENSTDSIESSRLRGKYAALKTMEYFFRQFSAEKRDDALLALAAFAMSLGDTSPAFFKVISDSSGQPGTVESFERGTALSLLLDDEGYYEPIVITDKNTFGGLEIKMKIQKAGENMAITISARSNGTTQGTIEISKIKSI